MPLNIADAEDSWLNGQAVLEDWKRESLLNWYAPLVRSVVGAEVQKLTPEQRRQIAARPDLPPQLRSLFEE